MSTAKIQSGDKVKITSGNHKGIVGIVTKVIKKTKPNGNLILRASVNTVPKIVKYRKSQSHQGQNYPGAKLQVDRTVDISNLQLITSDDKVSKSKIVIEDGKKHRVYKVNGQKVEKTKIEKKATITTNELETSTLDTTKATLDQSTKDDNIVEVKSSTRKKTTSKD